MFALGFLSKPQKLYLSPSKEAITGFEVSIDSIQLYPLYQPNEHNPLFNLLEDAKYCRIRRLTQL